MCVGPLAAEPQAVVSHDVTPSARRAGLLDLAPTAAARGERSPGGRWWRAQVAEDQPLKRLMATASYADFHRVPWREVEARALDLADGDADAAAWLLGEAERKRPRWGHERREAGRQGGLASGRARAAAAVGHYRTARRLRGLGFTVPQIMRAMGGRSRSAVQTWLNKEPRADLVTRAEAHAAIQRVYLAQVCARVRAEKEAKRRQIADLFQGGPTNVVPLKGCIPLLSDHLTRKGVEPPPEPAPSDPEPPRSTPTAPRRVWAWTCTTCHPEREARRHRDRCPECRPEPRFWRGAHRTIFY